MASSRLSVCFVLFAMAPFVTHTAELHAAPVTLTEGNFSEILARGPTLVMFYDKTCGICVDFAPRYELVAKELPKVALHEA